MAEVQTCEHTDVDNMEFVRKFPVNPNIFVVVSEMKVAVLEVFHNRLRERHRRRKCENAEVIVSSL